MQKVRDYIKQRLNSGESQSAIARKIGISQPTVAKIASGDVKASDGTAMKIARAYGLPLSYFLEDHADPAHDTLPGQPPLTKDEQMFLDMMRFSKTGLLAARELIRMNDEQRLQWIIDQQE